MQGDELIWHWDVPDSHPFASGIDFGFREGFAGSEEPKFESDAQQRAYRAGVEARREFRDEARHFSQLRVSVTGDDRVVYELTQRTD